MRSLKLSTDLQLYIHTNICRKFGQNQSSSMKGVVGSLNSSYEVTGVMLWTGGSNQVLNNVGRQVKTYKKSAFFIDGIAKNYNLGHPKRGWLGGEQ